MGQRSCRALGEVIRWVPAFAGMTKGGVMRGVAALRAIFVAFVSSCEPHFVSATPRAPQPGHKKGRTNRPPFSVTRKAGESLS
jgi:hypothetical protein